MSYIRNCGTERIDAVTKCLIETIGGAGYAVAITGDSDRVTITAIDERTEERFIVRGADVYSAAVELSEQLGFELDD